MCQNRPATTSVYETIEEELSGTVNSRSPRVSHVGQNTTPSGVSACVDTASVDLASNSPRDDEFDISALRKYYALRDEAKGTVVESRRLWQDTPFSVSAVQCERQYLCYFIAFR